MKFSVIIPVRDDAAGLGVALDGLQLQIRPADEVVIVNAGEEPLAPPEATSLPLRFTETGRYLVITVYRITEP